MVRFAKNIRIISSRSFLFQIYLISHDYKYFAISIALSILSTNIIVFNILQIALLLNIRKSRSLKIALHIRPTIYIKFRQLNSC